MYVYINAIVTPCYMVYTRLGVILVAGLRYVPFLLYVVLLRAIYFEVYQRITNCK